MSQNEINLETHITLREWIDILRTKGICITYDGLRKKVIIHNLQRFRFLHQKTPIYYLINELETKILPLLLAKAARFNSIKR